MERQIFSSGTPWEPVVGYSRAVQVGPFLFVAGTTATDEHGKIVGTGDLYLQTRQALSNIEAVLKRTGNPWHISAEDVEKDLYATHFTRLDGFSRMVWTTAHFDRNHWNPEDPMKSIEVFVANEYRAKNPSAEIRLINWDPPMTHYGHLELPKQLAAAHYSVVRWLVRP